MNEVEEDSIAKKEILLQNGDYFASGKYLRFNLKSTVRSR